MVRSRSGFLPFAITIEPAGKLSPADESLWHSIHDFGEIDFYEMLKRHHGRSIIPRQARYPFLVQLLGLFAAHLIDTTECDALMAAGAASPTTFHFAVCTISPISPKLRTPRR